MTDVRHGDDNILFDSDWSQPSFWALAHRVLPPNPMISVQTEGSSELGGGEETRALCLGDMEGRGPSCGSSPLGSNVSGCQGRSLLRTEKGPHPESVE